MTGLVRGGGAGRWLAHWLAGAALLAAAAAHAGVSVPMVLEKGIPVAQLTIGGATFPFTFDIGSSRTVHLQRDVMAKIPGLKLTGRKLKSADLSGKVREEEEFVIPDLVINGVSFGAVTGVSYEAWGLNIGAQAGPPPHSVIGLGLFARQPFVYNQSGPTLRFGAPLDPGQGWHALPHERVHEGIVATLSNGAARYRMVLDSAANISLVKPQSVQAQGDETAPCDLFGPGKPCHTVSIGLPGGQAIKPYLMPLPAFFQADGILGGDFFAQYAIFVDMANGRVAVRAPRGAPAAVSSGAPIHSPGNAPVKSPANASTAAPAAAPIGSAPNRGVYHARSGW